MTNVSRQSNQSIERFLKAEVTYRLRRMRDNVPTRKTWPEGCYGSALSWLLFVGPSPGGKPIGNHGIQRRKRTGGQCYWDTAFDLPYSRHPDAWGGKYRENMPVLIETIIGLSLEQGSAKLFGFANFDWIPSPKEGLVSSIRLKQGQVDVLKVLKLARPRIIAPTTAAAHARLLLCLRKAGYTFLIPSEQSVRIRIDPRGDSFHTQMDALKLKGRGMLAGTVVIRLPQHPARMLYRQHGHRCALAMRKALIQVYAEQSRLVIDES